MTKHIFSWHQISHQHYIEHILLFKNEHNDPVSCIILENPDNKWIPFCEDGQNVLKMALDNDIPLEEVLLHSFDSAYVIMDYVLDIPPEKSALYKDMRPFGVPSGDEKKLLTDFLLKVSHICRLHDD